MIRRFAACMVIAVALSACNPPPPPDTIYTNAVVWTGSGAEAQALAVSGDRFMAVGTTAEIEALAGEATEHVDLGGAFVVPGFIDNHAHFLSGGFQLASVDLRDAATPGEFARRIGEFAATRPAGTWILGGDWDHELWGGSLPDREWIDALTPDNPVFVYRLDGHMALANAAALTAAGVGPEVKDVTGGTIVRGDGGRLTGVFKDEAMGLVHPAIPGPTDTEFDEALERAMAHAASLGVTQVHDVGSYGGWRDLAVYRRSHDAGTLRTRIYSLVSISTWERLRDLVEEEGRGDDRLRWGGLKGFVDGSLGSTTAWFYEPYTDEPETSGLLVNDTTALRQWIIGADAAGLHVAVHAIGDRANDWLLDVFASAAVLNGERDRRFRIEHAQHLTREAIARFGPMDVVPSMQPYHAVDDGRWAEKRIGSDRIKTTYAFRSLLDAGAPLTFGSDWTVAPLDPRLGIHAALTRQTIDGANPDGWVPEERITAEEALKAYTATNAWAGFQEDRAGMIAPGFLADFAVLGSDLRTIDPEAIPFVPVLRTVVGGTTVFESTAASGSSGAELP